MAGQCRLGAREDTKRDDAGAGGGKDGATANGRGTSRRTFEAFGRDEQLGKLMGRMMMMMMMMMIMIVMTCTYIYNIYIRMDILFTEPEVRN